MWFVLTSGSRRNQGRNRSTSKANKIITVDPRFLLHFFKEFVVKQHNIDTRKALDMPKISPAELIGTSGKLRNTMGKSSRKPYL